ncbi:MAG: Lipid-A-disaccharide synthase [Pedosphaera sp.]|nr:Lipid-A-disaccharide synthase [Pedosphaera sp.]
MAAGEVSSDRQAGHLARKLLLQRGDAQLFGCGGGAMQGAGVDVRVETAQYGCIGMQESARFSKPLHRAMSDISTLVRSEKPDLAVLVDSEHFNGHVASFLNQQRIPFVYYFPPQVWLWGRWRARAVAKRSRLIIPAFLAEVDIYRSKGGRVQWCGHPLLDLVKPEADHEKIFREFGLDPSLPTMAIMPGSRAQELEELAPSLLAAARQIKQRHPQLQLILPVAAPHLLTRLQQEIAAAQLTADIKIIDQHVYTCLSRCEVVMLSSGTATLEVALLGVPMVVAYRVKPLTYFVARRVVSTRFIAMPNILLDEPIVPELIQKDLTVERLVAETVQILENPERRTWMRKHLRRIPPLLGTQGAISRAASLVLDEASIAPAARQTS